MLEYAILGFLRERPRSGYDLKTRCFDDAAKPFWTADQAQIYRTLDRLQKAAWVTVRRKRQSGKPDRKIYEVTQAGIEALDSWLATPLPLPPARDTFLVQLYFSASLADDALVALLEAQRASHQARLDSLRERSTALSKDPSLPPRDEVLKHTVLEGAIAVERATIDWLDDCIDAATQGVLPGSEQGSGQRHLFGTSPA